MGARDAVMQQDFYTGLLALLRLNETLSRYPAAPLRECQPRLQGYLQVALKHLPDIGGADYALPDLAVQWRTACLLRCAVPVSARWLQSQLAVECARLVRHAGFSDVHTLWAEDAAVIQALAVRANWAGT